VLLVAGCGTVAAPGAAPTQRPVAASRILSGSADRYFLQAQREARLLLAEVPVPPGSTQRSERPPAALEAPIMGAPATAHLVDQWRLWTVPMPMARTLRWLSKHPPAGLSWTASSSGSGPGGPSAGYSWSAPDQRAYRQAEAEAGVTPDGADLSILRTDGVDIWVSATPATEARSGPRLRVTAANGCPAQLGSATDVSNPDPQLRGRLVPSGQPTGGILCRYQRTLIASIPLDLAQARRLAAAAAAIQLGSSGTEMTSCPAGFFFYIIIALRYPGRPDADLWYYPSGCQYVDNGYVSASEVGNPSFYTGFVPTVPGGN
jgi:hypothetical protein